MSGMEARLRYFVLRYGRVRYSSDQSGPGP